MGVDDPSSRRARRLRQLNARRRRRRRFTGADRASSCKTWTRLHWAAPRSTLPVPRHRPEEGRRAEQRARGPRPRPAPRRSARAAALGRGRARRAGGKPRAPAPAPAPGRHGRADRRGTARKPTSGGGRRRRRPVPQQSNACYAKCRSPLPAASMRRSSSRAGHLPISRFLSRQLRTRRARA